MSDVIGLRFRLFEPMMFRGPGEFDPSSRGLQSSATSLLMPTPSTIVGTLSTLIMEIGQTALVSTHNWVGEYLSIIGADNMFKGPYLLIDERIFVEDSVMGNLIELAEAKERCRKLSMIVGSLENKQVSLDDALRLLSEVETLQTEMKGLKKRCLGSTVERVGIGLKTRDISKPLKVTKEGLIYSARLIDYSSLDKKSTTANIHMDIKGDLRNRLPIDIKVMRFGGEGRVSLLQFSKDIMIQRIESELGGIKNIFSGELALFLISPALFKTGKTASELKKKVEDLLNMVCEAWNIVIYGETELLGAGYSLSHRRRKPIYLALKPGTIVFANVTNCDLEKLYWNGLGEIGMEIGYGSFLPVPLPLENSMNTEACKSRSQRMHSLST